MLLTICIMSLPQFQVANFLRFEMANIIEIVLSNNYQYIFIIIYKPNYFGFAMFCNVIFLML